MSGPIGHTFLYNIIILFIVMVFGFLAGVLSYYKAFKVNNKIIYAIEKFEGYNTNPQLGGSIEEINKVLNTLGYSTEKIACDMTYKDMSLVSGNETTYRYCIYIDNQNPRKGEYYTYGVLTYMNIDLPFVNRINIPVFTKTNRIYKFN